MIRNGQMLLRMNMITIDSFKHKCYSEHKLLEKQTQKSFRKIINNLI
jgi:hypothetical protein